MSNNKKASPGISSFSGQFWLVVMFEFFERGAYYGMMSFISVYFVNILDFPKENVGVIKGVIQPLLYFLPIISGALADRFGYRKLFLIAFSFLGGGYLLTSQVTSYGAVFIALVIMGIGAGTFKPLITGCIANTTNEDNSTLGFGIYYWSINIGAFLFPLILVPFLKAINPTYVIIASGICTVSMIIPTILFFKDPVKLKKINKRDQTNLLQTLANAFEIIYSPIVLIYHQMRKSNLAKIITGVLLAVMLMYSIASYLQTPSVSEPYAKIGIIKQNTSLVFEVDRNMLGKDNYSFSIDKNDTSKINLTIFKPDLLENFSQPIIKKLHNYPGFEQINNQEIKNWITTSDKKITLHLIKADTLKKPYTIKKQSHQEFTIYLRSLKNFPEYQDIVTAELHTYPVLNWITTNDLQALYTSSQIKPFFLLFVVTLLIVGIFISFVTHQTRKKEKTPGAGNAYSFIFTLILGCGIWLLPGLSLLGRIISSVIYLSLTSLFIIDQSNPSKFIDHAKFLLMIFIYSGFWVLYFQMFDSVLWYVQAYVNSSSLNQAINNFLGLLGIHINWFFDVEHVTVINAGTIILLQIIISSLVKNKKALPTMIFGISLGTIGMAILAINTSIWVFLIGIMIFSLGEMTAHPKFYSYIGLIAPQDKKGMYMGYVFLYGVFGSSIGGIIGARLYVYFVDTLNQPKTLWLIFAGIGVITMVALALYNKFIKPHE